MGSRRKLLKEEEATVLKRVSWALQQERMEERSETVHSFQRNVRTGTPDCPSELC